MDRRFVAVIATLAVIGGSLLAATPAQAAVVVGVCTMKANIPHPSHHVDGMINAQGTADCGSVVMKEIYVKTTLEKGNGQRWPGKAYDSFNTRAGRSNSAIPCSTGAGTYRTVTSWVLYAPEGYAPSYSTGTTYSAWTSVACGVSSRVAPQETTMSAGEPDIQKISITTN